MIRFDAYRTADLIAHNLAAAGFCVGRDGSALSSSQYVTAAIYDDDGATVFEQVKIRVSDHVLPPTYGQMNGWADFEVGPHMEACDDWTRIVVRLCADAGLTAPAAVRALRSRRERIEDKARADREASHGRRLFLGSFESMQDAIDARRAAEARYDFGPAHGKPRDE